MRHQSQIIRHLVPSLLALGLISCGSAPAQQESAPEEFNVVSLSKGDATVFNDFAAEVQSGNVVEIRPRVSGYIDKISVSEGSSVKKGELIFKINEADFYQQVNAAKASVDRAIARVDQAALEVEKLKPLVAKNIISPYELKTAESNLVASQAELDQAKSQYQNALIDLGYTNVTSPVNGVVGRIVVRPGSLVSSSNTDPLTTVSGSGNAFAYFSFDEKKLLDITLNTPGNSLQEKVAQIPNVQFILADGSLYSQEGKMEAASGLIDASTGSIQMKASFPNPDLVMRTGSSGVVRLPVHYKGIITVPQRATYELQDKIMVYVVDPSTNTVNSRKIKVEGVSGNDYVVSEGLNEGDLIIYEGIGNVRDNMVIAPKVVEADSIKRQK